MLLLLQLAPHSLSPDVRPGHAQCMVTGCTCFRCSLLSHGGSCSAQGPEQSGSTITAASFSCSAIVGLTLDLVPKGPASMLSAKLCCLQEDHMALEVRAEEEQQDAANSIAMLRAGMESASAEAVELEQRRCVLRPHTARLDSAARLGGVSCMRGRTSGSHAVPRSHAISSADRHSNQECFQQQTSLC